MVSADRSTVRTGYQSPTAGYQSAVASGCQPAATSGQSTATSDWKKVKRLRQIAKKLCLQAVMPIQLEGDIPTAPRDISPLTFAEFRGPILGSVGGSDRWVETEAKWSKD